MSLSLSLHIPFGQDKSIVLDHPKLKKCSFFSLSKFPELSSCVWVLTSGTTASKETLKFVGIKQKALLASAKSFNDHFQITEKDIFLNTLPLYHIAGLAMTARQHLSEASLYHLEKWDTEHCLHVLKEKKVSLVNFVPTQVYDLVSQDLSPPPSLRWALVGGGQLSYSLYKKALQLGWPLVLCYSFTEASSLVATHKASLDWRGTLYPFELLPHVKLRHDPEHNLFIKSDSLFSAYFVLSSDSSSFIEQKEEEFLLDDRGHLEGEVLFVEGRKASVKKVLGELVHLEILKRKLETFFDESSIEKWTLLFTPCPRKENKVTLCVEKDILNDIQEPLLKFNDSVEPYERIEAVFSLEKIPKNELGKVKIHELKEELL